MWWAASRAAARATAPRHRRRHIPSLLRTHRLVSGGSGGSGGGRSGLAQYAGPAGQDLAERFEVYDPPPSACRRAGFIGCSALAELARAGETEERGAVRRAMPVEVVARPLHKFRTAVPL